jgi:bifunctional oligoribonuclease and PAP phosphatase NrnA
MLLFGLCTDTGYFRHLDARSSETFVFTSRLVAAGANPKQTFTVMNGGKTFGSRILISRILSRMKTYYNGRLIISFETLDDTVEFGLEGRDSDSLYQLIQSIAGVEAIVIVRQETGTNCTVGFRSLDRVDVSVIAASFGGGGHRQASGLSIAGTIDSLIPRFAAAFADQFPGIDA